MNHHEIMRFFSVDKKYERLFDAIVDRLVKRAVFLFEDGNLRINQQVYNQYLATSDAKLMRRIEKFIKDYPNYQAMLKLVQKVIPYFFSILSGNKLITEIIFKDGRVDRFAEIFKQNEIADAYNAALAKNILKAVLAYYAGGRRDKIRICEIGAGTGGVTSRILPSLSLFDSHIEYYYTDISSTFLREAKEQFSQYDWLIYQTLNVEEKLEVQGVGFCDFDIVIASNVLHDTRCIMDTLINVNRMLKKGGKLFLNEFTHMKEVLLYFAGFLHGWWLYEDPSFRINKSCLLTWDLWKVVLDKTGFVNVQSFGLAETPELDHQLVMVCQKEKNIELANELKSSDEKRTLISQRTEVHLENEPIGWVKQKVCKCLRTILKYTRVHLSDLSWDDSFLDLGIDSLELIELRVLLSNTFSVDLNVSFLFKYSTPNQVVEYFSNSAEMTVENSEAQLKSVMENERSKK